MERSGMLGKRFVDRSAPRARPASSPKEILAVVLYTRFPDQRHKFLLVRPFLVVLALCPEVMHNRFAIGLAHTKRAIAFLPRESRNFFFHPARGMGLEILDHIGQCHFGGESYQQMNVVRSTAGSHERDLLRFRDHTQMLTQDLRVPD